jgi:hypothetical protein
MSIFEKIFPDIGSVETQGVPVERMSNAMLAAKAFEGMLMSLRVEIPIEGFSVKLIKSPVVKDACDLLWQLVGSKITPAAATNAVNSIHFFVESKDKEFKTARAMILLPENFARMSVSNPPFYMGGLVYTASKAKDYWNLKIADEKAVEQRAHSMEAEFLHTVIRDYPQIESGLTPYQRKILEKYPEGIESALDVHYKTRPFDEKAGPPFPVNIEEMINRK